MLIKVKIKLSIIIKHIVFTTEVPIPEKKQKTHKMCKIVVT